MPELATETVERRLPLTRERVLEVAVELADREGLDAVSMRRLGQVLRVDAMAFYRHVRNKEDLFDGIVTLVVGEIDLAEPEADWKTALRGQVMAARSVMLQRPWARRLLEDRTTVGPAVLAYIESVLAILRGGGFSVELAHHAIHVLGSRILGFNQDLFEDAADSDPNPEASAILARSMADRYPRVTELALSVRHDGVLGACDDDLEFAFGLDLILDGLERFVTAPVVNGKPRSTRRHP